MSTLTVEADPVETPVRLMEIAEKNRWHANVSAGLSMTVIVFGATPPHKTISSEKVELGDPVEMERKYGPRPAKK